MLITTDVILKGPAWSEMHDRLVGEFFKTTWDLYALCISIGMMYDGQIDTDQMVSAGDSAGNAVNETLNKSMNMIKALPGVGK